MLPHLVGTATGPHLYWITSRAAGLAALLLSSAAVGVGVTMGGRLVKKGGPSFRVTHEALSLATMVAIVVHGASLLGDNFMHPSVADVTVPFASGYKEPWMALGIVAGWSMIALGLSYYLRARIGVARWKVLHRFTALAWVLGLAHSLGEGTDAGTSWFLVSVGLVTVPAAVLVLGRLVQAGVPSPRTAS
jgi:methionine sulfoxide reductase heme-binding subunit